MKNFSYLLFFLLISSTLNAQFNSKSFDVTEGDLTTNRYLRDTISKALVIYEKGYSYINKKNFNLITEVEKKVKIFDKNSDKTTIEIYLYKPNKGPKDEIRDIEAITYNYKSGVQTQSRVKQSEIFREEKKNFIILKFTMPKIEDNSVITYKYTKSSNYIYNFEGWRFQSDIPKLYSEYNASIPGNYQYHIKLVGYKTLDEQTSRLERHCLEGGNGSYADCSVSKYVMKNVPAIIEEDYMTTIDNYISQITYELKEVKYFDGRVSKKSISWSNVDKKLKFNEAIGKQLKSSAGVRKWQNNNQLDKAKLILKFIQDTYTWNGKYELHKKSSIKNLVKTKSGKASEINMLLHNNLKENGINVNPVLLSTRKRGFATKLHPVVTDFNYLIVEANIDGKNYYLDATNKYLAFGQLPYKCLNQYGRRLDFKNGSSWVDIKAKDLSSIQQKVILTLNTEDEIIEGTIEGKYQGYYATDKKGDYFPNQTKYVENIQNENEDFFISNHLIETDDITDSEFIESYDIEYEDLNFVGDEIILDPFLIKIFEKNPFQLQQRTYPVDFGYKQSFIYSLQLDLGDEYTIEKLPEEVTSRLPLKGGNLVFNTQLQDNKLLLFFKVSFTKPIYEANHYPSLKRFMNKVVNAQTKTLLVLKKK